MAKTHKFRVATTIYQTNSPYATVAHSVFIQAHSTDDAGRRVIAALNLIDEAKEGANEPETL